MSSEQMPNYSRMLRLTKIGWIESTLAALATAVVWRVRGWGLRMSRIGEGIMLLFQRRVPLEGGVGDGIIFIAQSEIIEELEGRWTQSVAV